MTNKQFKYTGMAKSLDNHDSDFYKSPYWLICVWNGIVLNSKKQLQGELESNNGFYHFWLFDGLIVVERSILSVHEGLGKRYIEGHLNFPIPNYVCDFIRSLEEKYVHTK